MDIRRGEIRVHGYRELRQSTPVTISQGQNMHLGKYHGLGNDFLVALSADNPNLEPDPQTARALCDRRAGIGADGLVYALLPADPINDARMVLLNSDGSSAEISGNGIRCMAHALLAQDLPAGDLPARGDGTAEDSRDRAWLCIETAGGLRRVDVVEGDPRSSMVLTVDMGEPSAGPAVSAAAAAYGALHVTTVDIGNPHLVLCVANPDKVDLTVQGPLLEVDYPAGINVHFISVDQSGAIDLRVWERGAGVTLACGSGAVAAAVAANSWGMVGSEVQVRMPGGVVTVEVTDDTVRLTGPSVFVATVDV